jgi:dihydroorotate dehydrogenase electron transfer subunit
MKQLFAQIVSNSPVLPNQNIIWFAAPEIADEIQPGQFVMIRTGETIDPFLRRPMSIHRVIRSSDQGPGKTPGFGLLIGTGGGGTSWLAHQPAGTPIDILGPLGHGFEIHPGSKNLLMVGGGYGVAPLIGFAEMARLNGHEVQLLVGAQSTSAAYPLDLLPPGIRMDVITNDGSSGKTGLVTDYVKDYADWADQICACGPVPMYRSLKQAVEAAGFQGSVQVLMEEKMACGVGTCASCQVTTAHGPKLVCTDGPMFEVKDLAL